MSSLCIYGSGDREQIYLLLRRFLEEKGVLKRVKDYGRVSFFKTGVFSRVSFIYYHSDNSFKICGERKLVEEFREYAYRRGVKLEEKGVIPIGVRTKTEEEMLNPVDYVSSLLIERNTLLNKYVASIRDIKYTSLGLVTAYIVLLWLTGNPLSPLTILLLLLIYIIFISLPHISYLTSWKTYIPILFLHYKRRIKEIDEELKKYKILLPQDHPLRKVIDANIETFKRRE